MMVHGNHEGFEHLQTLERGRPPRDPVTPDDLHGVDRNGHVRLLPSGWKVALPGGCVVAGVGGIERGQRRAEYHPMAYIDDRAVEALCDGGPVDVLVTHQGPAEVQGEEAGSQTLQFLLDQRVARAGSTATPRRTGTSSPPARTARAWWCRSATSPSSPAAGPRVTPGYWAGVTPASRATRSR